MTSPLTPSEERELRELFDSGRAGMLGKMALVSSIVRLIDTLDAERAARQLAESERDEAKRQLALHIASACDLESATAKRIAEWLHGGASGATMFEYDRMEAAAAILRGDWRTK